MRRTKIMSAPGFARLSAPGLALCVLTISCTPTPPGEGGGDGNPTVVAVDSGGSLEFQAGTLPSSATVSAKTVPAPILPPGVTPIGEAIEISADDATTRPMTIRLPIPEGVDADRVSIFLIRQDGSTTMLGTEVDDGFAVAATDHFTITPDPIDENGKLRLLYSFPELDAVKSALGVRDDQTDIPQVSPPRPAMIVGPTFLSPGQVALFSLVGLDEFSGSALNIEWNLYALGSTLAVPDGQPASGSPAYVLLRSRSARLTVGAGASGRIDLTCSYVDPASGTRGFASKAISVQSAEDVGSLALTYLEGSTERVAGERGPGFLIGILNGDVLTASFTWNYGTGNIGDTGGQGLVAGMRTVRSPEVTYDEPGVYTFAVTAASPDGRTGEITIPVTVRATSLEAIIEGPTIIERAVSAFDSDAFTVRITGGTPPYTVTRSLFPGGTSNPQMTDADLEYSLALNEPGSYVQSVTVTDAAGSSAMFTLPLTVTTTERMVFDFGPETPTALVDQTVSFVFSAQGGLLIVNGIRAAGYQLEVSWGDGESSRTEIASAGSLATVNSALVHAYGEPGDYTVEATLIDAAGNAATATAPITIEEDHPPCPVPCDTDGACVAANAGAACVDNCCFECERDEQCPGEQVCSETLECVDPCTFCCLGDGVCDSGDGCADADCALCAAADGVCIKGCEPNDVDCVVVTNITAEGGASASSTFSPDFPASDALDGLTSTNWFSNGSSGGNSEVFTWVRTEAADASITRIETDPEAFEGGGGFGFVQAQVTVFNTAGEEVYSSGFMVLPGFRVDLDLSLPAGIEGRTVQILLVDHQDPSCGGFSEFRVFGLRLVSDD